MLIWPLTFRFEQSDLAGCWWCEEKDDSPLVSWDCGSVLTKVFPKNGPGTISWSNDDDKVVELWLAVCARHVVEQPWGPKC